MACYAETKPDPRFSLMVGMDRGRVVFCHTFAQPSEQRAKLELERQFFPDLVEDEDALAPIFRELNRYWNGDGIDPADIGVDFSRGTPFEIKIWKTLRMVKKGRTISYQELGEQAGYPNSQRAVGGAMARNYLLLFVPCHRVVSKNSGLGGFSAGIEKKEFLLRLEKKS